MKQIYSNEVKEYLKNKIATIIILFLIPTMVYFINTHIIRIVTVSGESMCPTFMDKDILLVNQMNYIPSRGDVVLIDISGRRLPGQYIVKRIIAEEGDTISLDYEENSVYINGIRVSEPYLNFDQSDPMTALDSENIATYNVPTGTVFVMGDNRNNSIDSRHEVLGMVSKSDIVGIICCRVSFLHNFSWL